MSTATAGFQLDLFNDPVPAPSLSTNQETEIRPCGTCGGKGDYRVNTETRDNKGRAIGGSSIRKTCNDCQGKGARVVPVKADCPPAAKSAGIETGSILAATAFTRAMVAAGYARKVTHGGDVNLRKAKQCCNALIHNVASDRPEPSVTTWRLATEKLDTLQEWEHKCLGFIEDDPDPGACARRVAAVEAARGTK